MLESIYIVLWDFVFDGAGSLPLSWAELCCTLCSTLATLFMIAIPFVVLWRVVTLIVKGW